MYVFVYMPYIWEGWEPSVPALRVWWQLSVVYQANPRRAVRSGTGGSSSSPDLVRMAFVAVSEARMFRTSQPLFPHRSQPRPESFASALSAMQSGAADMLRAEVVCKGLAPTRLLSHDKALKPSLIIGLNLIERVCTHGVA